MGLLRGAGCSWGTAWENPAGGFRGGRGLGGACCCLCRSWPPSEWRDTACPVLPTPGLLEGRVRKPAGHPSARLPPCPVARGGCRAPPQARPPSAAQHVFIFHPSAALRSLRVNCNLMSTSCQIQPGAEGARNLPGNLAFPSAVRWQGLSGNSALPAPSGWRRLRNN